MVDEPSKPCQEIEEQGICRDAYKQVVEEPGSEISDRFWAVYAEPDINRGLGARSNLSRDSHREIQGPEDDGVHSAP